MIHSVTRPRQLIRIAAIFTIVTSVCLSQGVIGWQEPAPSDAKPAETATAETTPATTPISFKADVAQILQDHCVACHGAKKAEGGYRVDTFAKLKLAGDSGVEPVVASQIDQSELVRRLITEDASERMPEGGERLPEAHIEAIKRWVQEGAAYDGSNTEENIASIIPPIQYPNAPEHYAQPIPVTAVVWNPSGDAVVTGGYHELLIWNAADGLLRRSIPNLPQRIHALKWHPDGKQLVVAGGTPGRIGEVRWVDMESGQITRVLPRTGDVILDVAFSPDGTRLATAGADALIRIYDATTNEEKPLQVFSSHSDWVYAIGWSPDGKRMASASRDKTAKFFDTEKGELLLTYSGHAAPVRGVAFTPNGAEVYSVGADHKVHRWKTENAQKGGEFGTGSESLRLGSQGSLCWVAGANKHMRLYDMEKNAEVRAYTGHHEWVLAGDYHAATKRLVGSSHDGEVIIWNMEDGKELGRWKGRK